MTDVKKGRGTLCPLIQLDAVCGENLEGCQVLIHVNDLSESLLQAAPDLP